MKNNYVSLDEARTELHKRWQDIELKKAIETELGEHFFSNFRNAPRGFTWKSLPTPDNGFMFFYHCAQYVKSNPLVFSYIGDKFASINPDKKNLATPLIYLRDGRKLKANISDINQHEGKSIKQVKLRCGTKLVDFHQKLFELSRRSIELVDMSKWCQTLGSPKHYYCNHSQFYLKKAQDVV